MTTTTTTRATRKIRRVERFGAITRATILDGYTPHYTIQFGPSARGGWKVETCDLGIGRRRGQVLLSRAIVYRKRARAVGLFRRLVAEYTEAMLAD